MGRLEYGTKVLVFKDVDDCINGGYDVGTIVPGKDYDDDSCEYMVKLDESGEIREDIWYYDEMMTPEDYKKYLAFVSEECKTLYGHMITDADHQLGEFEKRFPSEKQKNSAHK